MKHEKRKEIKDESRCHYFLSKWEDELPITNGGGENAWIATLDENVGNFIRDIFLRCLLDIPSGIQNIRLESKGKPTLQLHIRKWSVNK